MLNYVFSSETSEISAKAFALFEHCRPNSPNSKLIEAALEYQAFNNIASKILRQKSISPLMISRISQITYVIFTINPNFIETCGFIFQLFKYLSETSVISLFESICRPNQEYTSIQQWLIQIGFLKLLQNEVDSFRCPNDADRLNEDANLLASYYYLIKICAMNPVFYDQIYSHSFVYILNRDIGSYPQFVEDARWEALAAIYHPKTSEMMGGLFQVAIEIVSDVEKCRTRAAIAALSVLRGMVYNDTFLFQYINSYSIPLTVLQIMIENHSHSILHKACRDFISACFSSDKLEPSKVKQVLTLIVLNYNSDICHLRASLKFLANSLLLIISKKPHLVKIAKEIDDFPAFVSDLYKYNVNINTFYGGVVEYKSDEAQKLALDVIPVLRLF